jgi:hypothetical protein
MSGLSLAALSAAAADSMGLEALSSILGTSVLV